MHQLDEFKKFQKLVAVTTIDPDVPVKQTVNEDWGTKMHTPKSKVGMFKGQSKEEIKTGLERDKAKTNKTAAVKKDEHRREFALRAKNHFGKVSESPKVGKSKVRPTISGKAADRILFLQGKLYKAASQLENFAAKSKNERLEKLAGVIIDLASDFSEFDDLDLYDIKD